MTAAVEIIGLTKRFGDQREVLRSIAMRIDAGERVALLGESGVGKSTLLNLIAGLERPDAGEIRLSGVPIQDLDEAAAAQLRAREIGFVFQAFHLVAHLQVWQNVAIPLLLNGRRAGDARAQAAAYQQGRHRDQFVEQPVRTAQAERQAEE